MSTSYKNNYLQFPHNASRDGKVSRALKFLTTDRGRGIIYYAMGATTIGVAVALCLKETFFLEQIMNRFRIYEDEFPMEVPERLEAKIDACMDKGKVSAFESTQVKSLMINGFDMRSFGSSKSRYHGFVGIPINYLYKSTSDIDKDNLKLGEKSIDWDSEPGQLLEKSLVLTEDEKDFGLLKSILELRNLNFQHGCIVPGACIYGLYMGSKSINQKLGLYHKPRPLRLLVYTILSGFSYGMYSIITGLIRLRRDLTIDKTLAEIGPEMCESGVRFYEKLMNKNVALRELGGDHLAYTEKGNENPGWIRWSKLALSTRKLYFKHMLDEARKKEAENAGQTAEQNS